jgi:hypothetical protein
MQITDGIMKLHECAVICLRICTPEAANNSINNMFICY